jgi:hypothetical protein
MNSTQKNWVWFIAILTLIVGGGIYLANSRRPELGEGFSYSVDEYRQVDPSLIHYVEADSVFPDLGNLSALTLAPDGQIVVGGEKGITGFPNIGNPSCLAVDEEGTIFAGMNDHVEIFPKVGKKQAWPSPGPKAYLTSIAVDDEFVFVADAGSRCVWRYPKEGGEPLKIESDRKFYIPSPYFDLDIGTDGSLWVVNPGYHAFENISADGRAISSWENASMSIEGFSGCCNPAHFALMPDGSFLTAEKGLPRVKIHNLDGSLRCVVAAPDQFDETIGDVAVDEAGKIFVLSGNRVRVFKEKM